MQLKCCGRNSWRWHWAFGVERVDLNRMSIEHISAFHFETIALLTIYLVYLLGNRAQTSLFCFHLWIYRTNIVEQPTAEKTNPFTKLQRRSNSDDDVVDKQIYLEHGMERNITIRYTNWQTYKIQWKIYFGYYFFNFILLFFSQKTFWFFYKKRDKENFNCQ